VLRTCRAQDDYRSISLVRDHLADQTGLAAMQHLAVFTDAAAVHDVYSCTLLRATARWAKAPTFEVSLIQYRLYDVIYVAEQNNTLVVSMLAGWLAQ